MPSKPSSKGKTQPIILVILLSLFLSLSVRAQQEPCGTDHLMEILNQDPQMRKKRNSLNEFLMMYQKREDQAHAQRLLENENEKNGELEKVGVGGLTTPACGEKNYLYTIPTIVHVVHSSKDSVPGWGNNLSDATIRTLIRNLNYGFRNTGYFKGGPTNPHPAVQDVDVHIEFRLAQYDKNFKQKYFPGEPGICRWKLDQYTHIATDQEDRNMKRHIRNLDSNAFPTTQYCNIYIVPTSDIGAGYAYLAEAAGASYDGIVVVALYAKTGDRGVTLIHEAGHYLNLIHTFSGGCSNPGKDCYSDGDRVCDTPPQTSSANSRSCRNSCSNDAVGANTPFTSDQEDLCQDYMDYSSHSIKNTFTYGQRSRMRGTLISVRKTLLSWQHVLDSSQYTAEFVSTPGEHYYSCDSAFTPSFKIVNNSARQIDSFGIRMILNGKLVANTTVNDTISSGEIREFQLKPIALTENYNIIEFELTRLNSGVNDYLPNPNHCIEVTFLDSLTGSHLETFNDSSTAYWTIVNPDKQRGLQFTDKTGCDTIRDVALMYHSFTNQGTSRNESEYLMSRVIDLNNKSIARLRFKRAYTESIDNYNTVLDIRVSPNCSDSFITVYSKTKEDLASVDGREFNDWFPESCTDWAADSVILDSFTGYDKIIVQFVVRTDSFTAGEVKFGNNLFLDDIDFESRDCPPREVSMSDTTLCSTSLIIQGPEYESYRWDNGDTTRTTVITESGTYVLQGIGHYGCVYSDTVGVILHPFPYAELPADTLSCDGPIAIGGNPSYKNQWNTGDTNAVITVNQSGLYIVAMTNSFQCSSSDSIYVKLSTPPAPPTISRNFDVIQSSVRGNGHQWYMDGQPVEGAIRDYISPKKNGTYTLTYTDTGGCTSAPSEGFVVNWLASISSVDYNTSIYPNPYQSSFRIGSIDRISSVRIYDILGRQVEFDISVEGNELHINPHTSAKIIYVEIQNDGKVRVFKMVQFVR